MLASQFVAARLRDVAVLSQFPAAPTPSAPIVCTHDGSFHCDEALACALLRCVPEYADCSILRTRNPEWISNSFAAVDVGGEYVPERRRFDHHQKEFQGTMTTALKPYKTRLSSAGLVYRHFGEYILRQYAAHCFESGLLREELPQGVLDIVFDRVYRTFVEQVDGIDNGVEEFSGDNLTRNYEVTTTLGSRVARLNPRWNQPSSPDFANRQFVEAMKLTANEFFDAVEGVITSWVPARSIVEAGFAAAEQIDPSGQIVVLESGGCPWKDHLTDIEAAHNKTGRTLYVVYPDVKSGYRVQCVPKDNSSFANRKSLSWCGLRDQALVDASGVPGATFVHVTGFIGGNATREGAIAMAKKSAAA